MATSSYYGVVRPVSQGGYGERPYLDITVTQGTTKWTFVIAFGIQAYSQAISAGHTAKGVLKGNLEWKSYSKTTTALAKLDKLQLGRITIEKEKYADSTRSFEVEWDGDITTEAIMYDTTAINATYTVTIPALQKYTISYNGNGSGATGVPSSQTKIEGKSLTLTTTKPTRTGYNFVKWNTKSDGSGTNYASGGTYTANAGATLYAQWSPVTYTVSYNANGGTGAPANQTKTYNVTLKLSSIKPTRTNYDFVSWNEKADGTGASYGAGANYTANKAITLYAIWKQTYRPPTIDNLTAYRVDTNGESDTEGVQAKVDFTWGIGSGSNNEPISPSNGVIKWKKTTESTYNNSVSFDDFPMNQDNTGGEISILIGATGSTLDTSFQYDVQVILTVDDHPDIVRTTYISVSSFIIDINTAGNAVGIGMAAPDVDASNNPITGNSQLHIGSDIYLNSNNAFKKDITVEKSSSWDTPKVIVTQNDENNNLTAKGALTSTYGGNFGLYDQKHNKWLIRSDTDGRPHIGFSPYTLHSTKVACTKVGTAYENTTIASLANWNIVAVYFVVHQHSQLLWFIRGIQTDISLTDRPDAGYFRGSILVDWTNKRISMRCVNAGTSGTNYNLVYFQGVYGIM